MLQTSVITNSTEEINMAAVSTRNIVFCAISFLNAFVVFILVVTTTNLKMPIKITLLNLLASDMCLLLTGIVYGWFVQTKLDSGHSLCIVTVFLMINGFFLSHTAVAGISLNNFLAIFYPFKHSILVTTKSVTISIVTTWLSLSFMSAMCIVFHIEQNEPCVVLSNIPRYGAMVVFCVLFLADFSVIVMNGSLCMAIRRRKQVHVNTVFSIYRGRWAQKRMPAPRIPEQLKPVRNQLEDKAAERDNTDEARNVTRRAGTISTITDASIHKQDHHHQLPQQQERRRKKKFSLKVTYHRNNINVKFEPQPSTSSASDKPSTSGSNQEEKNASTQSPGNTEVPLLENVQTLRDVKHQETHGHADLCIAETTRTKTKAKRNQFRRLSVSMIIISIWCCAFNVPCSLYLFYVAFIAENRLQANYSTLGIIFTTLLVINIMGDPFIYAWRFVQWKIIVRKLRKVCCERQYF